MTPRRTLQSAIWAAFLVFAVLAIGQQQVQRDVLGVHDLGAGSSPVSGSSTNACNYCHAPHNALSTTPLWNQRLSTQQHTLHPNATDGSGTQTSVNRPSVLCLSCHDGTVAIGSTVATGSLDMVGSFTSNLGTKLEGSHPFSVQPQLRDGPTLVSTLVASHQTKDEAVRLIDNNVECSSCHDVHNQFRDSRQPMFLVRDNASSRLCLSCHDVAARTVNGRENSLVPWLGSAHAVSTAQLGSQGTVLGSYANVGEVGCSTCHASHGAVPRGLLRKLPTPLPGVDETSQTCLRCHDGSDTLAQPLRNVLAEFQKGGHPFADASNTHMPLEPVLLDRNRHATCADCHNAHAAQPTQVFTPTADLRPSQMGVSGVGVDGTTRTAATLQFENCLRCHGDSVNKQSLPSFGYMPARALFPGDTLNVRLEFAPSAVSSHPVMRDSGGQVQFSLRPSMLALDGQSQARPMGTRILCTDCHNSDNNREFGGTGPNGPHGSRNSHMLERQYVASQVNPGVAPAGGPGSRVVNLNPNPLLDASPAGPYALCAKCHDLQRVNTRQSSRIHREHLEEGFSCSVCHSAHGVPAGTAGVNGTRLVNFDLNVVAPNAGVLTYSAQGCTLTCHMKRHKP